MTRKKLPKYWKAKTRKKGLLKFVCPVQSASITLKNRKNKGWIVYGKQRGDWLNCSRTLSWLKAKKEAYLRMKRLTKDYEKYGTGFEL